MYYLYGRKPDRMKLVATFGSEQQLLAYVRWATLKEVSDVVRAFEQGSVLAGYQNCQHSATPLTDEPEQNVPHNPSPTML
jgi:hypothetical protein